MITGVRRAPWLAGSFALLLFAGGCTATAPPQVAAPAAAVSASPAALGPPLPYASSEADLTVDQGLAAALDKEFASAQYKDLRSVIVLAHGRTAYERYFKSGSSDYHQVFSVTKSVISTLIGIAIAERAIPSVDATLAELLPDHAEQMTKAVAKTTLKQLLTMKGGFNTDDPEAAAPNWVADILDKQVWDPGTHWYYSNNSAHLAAAVLAEATGMPVLDYARAKLFDPLGIPTTPAAQPDVTDPDVLDGAGFGWAVDPQDINLGGYGLRLRAQDMAKLGLLFLHNGSWEGHQVVPADWVHQATTKRADNGGDGYGYLWWVIQLDGDPSYAAVGSGGQRIIVIPDRQLVIVSQVWTDPATGNHAQTVEEKLNNVLFTLIAPTYKA